MLNPTVRESRLVLDSPDYERNQSIYCRAPKS